MYNLYATLIASMLTIPGMTAEFEPQWNNIETYEECVEMISEVVPVFVQSLEDQGMEVTIKRVSCAKDLFK